MRAGRTRQAGGEKAEQGRKPAEEGPTTLPDSEAVTVHRHHLHQAVPAEETQVDGRVEEEGGLPATAGPDDRELAARRDHRQGDLRNDERPSPVDALAEAEGSPRLHALQNHPGDHGGASDD